MALKVQINESEFSALPEQSRDWYFADGDGGYLLDIEPDDETRGLKNALVRSREERNGYRERAAAMREAFGDANDDPDECRRLMGALEKRIAEAGEPLDEKRCNEILAQRKAEHEARLETMRVEHEARVAPLNKQLAALRLDDALDAAMRTNGVRDTMLLMPHLRAVVRLVSDPMADEVALSVVDKRGNVRLRADGVPVSVAEQLKEWQTLDPSLSRCFHEPTAWRMATAVSNGNGKVEY